MALGLSLTALPSHPTHQRTPLTQRLSSFYQILSQPRFLVFYLGVALLFGSHGAHYIYAIPEWREMGFGSAKIYGVLAWSVVVEIIFFLIAPKSITDRPAALLLTICAGGRGSVAGVALCRNVGGADRPAFIASFDLRLGSFNLPFLFTATGGRKPNWALPRLYCLLFPLDWAWRFLNGLRPALLAAGL